MRYSVIHLLSIKLVSTDKVYSYYYDKMTSLEA